MRAHVPDDTSDASEDAEIDEVRAAEEPPEEAARELPEEGHPGDPASYLRP